MSGNGTSNVEGVAIVLMLAAYLLWLLVRKFARSRPGFNVGTPIAVGFAIRLAAIAGISASGLESVLRGGDERTFLALAQELAAGPIGHGFLPHGPYQLQTDLFALQLKLGFLSVGALRITQVLIAMTGLVLILAAVYDLAGPRAPRLAAWIFALEPASIFFNSALHKEPLMELAAGLVVFGGTMLWRKLDVRGILLCALGGLIACETRAYAGWFLVAAAVFVLLAAALRSLDRPLRAMPLVYAVAIIAFVAVPAVVQASSKKNLQSLQESQTANALAIGTGTGGPNSDNLALEKVNFSTRGQILKHLPTRMLDLIFRPYPWQLSDASQRFGAIGTLVAYAILFLLLRYAWISRGAVFRSIGPIVLPLFFLLMAYSLSAGNAGTGFRYRTHLVTLAIAAMVVLREQAVLARDRRAAEALAAYEGMLEPRGRGVPATV